MQVVLNHIYYLECLCIHAERGITEYIRIYNITEEENDWYSTFSSQFLLH